MSWFQSLPPDVQVWLIGLPAQIGTGLVVELSKKLLEVSGKRVARQFEEPSRQTAMQQALQEGLAAAVSRLPLSPDLRQHYLDLFGKFIQRENVVLELCQILDPRPDTVIHLDLLCGEFLAAGFDPDYLPGTAFDELILVFIGAFYDAAAKKEELQGAMQIALLRKLVEESGAMRFLTERVAVATETSAGRLSELVELAEQMVRGQADVHTSVEAIRNVIASDEPGRKFDAYQVTAAGLGRTGRYVSVEPDGRLTITVDPTPELQQPIDLTPLRDVLEELRQAILQPGRQPSAEELEARLNRYLELAINLFKNLRLEGLSTSIKPILLPLESVYVHLRAVAEVPEAADVFTPEERRLLHLIEEGSKEEELREAHLRLDAIRRERWTKERLERFPIADALKDPQRHGLVILGDPGSGKTTLLNFLALVYAQGPQKVTEHLHITGLDADRLPIFAPLAAYDDMLNETPDLTIREFLECYYDRRRANPGLGPVFENALNSGRALVLLDGLDEVIEESRRKFVAEQASVFINDVTAAGNRVILTSRIYGYRAAPLRVELSHVTVLDFRRKEIEIFARQWCRAIAAWEADNWLTPQAELQAQVDERCLLDEVRSNPGIESLAVNPLLLTMLALLRRQVGGLPQRRIELYDLYIRSLI